MDCYYLYSVATSTPYHLTQIYQFILAILANLLILAVEIIYLPKLRFHKNTKILIWSDVIAYQLFAFYDLFAQVSHLYFYYSARHPCDVILPVPLASLATPFILFITSVVALINIFMWMELIIASALYHKYENYTGKIAVVLVIISVILPIRETVANYNSYNRSEPTINYATKQDSNMTDTINRWISGIIYSVIGLIVLCATYQWNQWRSKKSNYHLSTRYQLSMNMIAIKFVIMISLVKTTLHLVYTAAQVAMSFYQKELFHGNDVALRTARNLFFMVPLQSACLPLTILIWFRFSKKATNQPSTILRRSDETEAYQQELRKQWGLP